MRYAGDTTWQQEIPQYLINATWGPLWTNGNRRRIKNIEVS